MGGQPGGRSEPAGDGGARDWRCDVCNQPAVHVVGVAALVGDRLRFWLGGCCRDHEDEVRERRKSEARELGVPEITLTQVLAPDEVTEWIHRLTDDLSAGDVAIAPPASDKLR